VIERTVCRHPFDPGHCQGRARPCEECVTLRLPGRDGPPIQRWKTDKTKYRYCWQDPAWKAREKEKQKERTEKERLKRKADPNKYRAKDKNWRERNKEHYLVTHRISVHRRRVKLKKNGGKRITEVQWKALCEQTGNRCLACGQPGNYITLTMDHIIPIKKGGKDGISNIQPLCRSCNSSKGIKIIDYRNVKDNLSV
jgi:5-methylcytosine-specific restriction endonuclease McrA